MKQHRKHTGYTIVEVMVFLAVSSFMFVIAAGFVNGKQAKAQFRDGVYDLSAVIQATINDVSNGVYPDSWNQNYQCTADAANASPPNISPGGSTVGQGEHLGCVFLGKAFEFTIGSSQYSIASVGARQFKPNSTDLPENFSDARPKILKQGGVDLTEYKTIKWNIPVTRIVSIAPPRLLEGFGFFSSFSSSAGGQTLSGSQTVNVAGFPKSPGPPNISTEVNNHTNLTADIINNPNIIICLSDGDQFGTVTVGGADGQKLVTKPQIYSSLPSEC